MPKTGPRLAREALAAEEEADIGHLLERIGGLPPDSKLASLKGVLAELRRDGYGPERQSGPAKTDPGSFGERGRERCSDLAGFRAFPQG